MGSATDRHDDAALVNAIVAGSQDALASLYDRHADGIFAAVSRLTQDRGMAEEVVQETFLALWDRAESYDPRLGSLATWLRTIARNRTVDRLRAAGRRPGLTPMSSVLGGRDAGDADADTLERLMAGGDLLAASTPTRSPAAEAELAELREALRDALRTMPEEERMVIVLAYGEDLSQSEIANRLDWPLGTVKTRTRRALRHMREVLGSGVGPEYARYLAPADAVGPDH